GDAWSQLVVLQRARHLRPVQLHAADAQQRQYRHRQYDDPHAAEPLQLLPVEQQRPGQGIEPGDDSGAGGGQAGEGFEHRIGHAQIGQLQQVQRYRSEQAQHRPEKYGDQIAVPGTQLVALVAYRQPDQQAHHQGDGKAGEEGVPRRFAKIVTDRSRRQHCQGEQHQQYADDALDLGILHGRLPVRKGCQRNVRPIWNSRSTSRICFLSITNRMTWSSLSITRLSEAISTFCPRTTAPMVVPGGSLISRMARPTTLEERASPWATISMASAAPRRRE